METEKEKLRVEYKLYQEDKEKRLKLMTAEVAMQRQQCNAQLEELQTRNSKLEHKLLSECGKALAEH